MVKHHPLIDEYFTTGTVSGLPTDHYINGQWVKSSGTDRLELFDPALERSFHTVAAGNADDIDLAVMAAKAAQQIWGSTKASLRGNILSHAAALIRADAKRLAIIESLDSGKPLQEAEGDIAGAARCLDYYAGAADKMEGASFPLGPDYVGYSEPEPVGVTGHIIPWNYPFSTVIRSLAPALAAGCCAVVKPAETTPLTALLVAEILSQAGLPAGVCNVVTGTGAQAGAALVSHPDIRHVTFTGSVGTGIAVMQAAAKNITSVVLELGGKSPLIVMADADLDAAVEGILGAIYENAGQICSAGSRLVIDRAVYDEVVERLMIRAQALTMDHGLLRPQLGPLNSFQHREKVATYVDEAKLRHVTVITGGERAVNPKSGKGWFYQPTILGNMDAQDPVIQEEIFGPVLAVQCIDGEEEAISVANDTQFGLVAGIYTRDFGAAHRMARKIDAGQIFVNEYFAGGIEVPFGGNKLSGIGREKGLEALRSYQRTKSFVARIK